MPKLLRSPVIGLALFAGCLASTVCAVQIVYQTEAPSAFVDVEGQSQPTYVVGFVREGPQPAPAPPPVPPHRVISMRSANGTQYRCYVPESGAAEEEDEAGTGVTMASKGSLSLQKTPSQLLDALAEHCYYRIEEWWTYELCFKKQLRQYHKENGKLVSQYIMGVYSQTQKGQPDPDAVQVDPTDVTGATRYVAQRFAEGEVCELTGKPREAEVRFSCGTGSDTVLTSIKELASCTYVATVATPRLCKHPAFQRQPPLATAIQCHPVPAEAEGAEAGTGGESSSGGSSVGQCSAEAGEAGSGTCAAVAAEAAGGAAAAGKEGGREVTDTAAEAAAAGAEAAGAAAGGQVEKGTLADGSGSAMAGEGEGVLEGGQQEQEAGLLEAAGAAPAAGSGGMGVDGGGLDMDNDEDEDDDEDDE